MFSIFKFEFKKVFKGRAIYFLLIIMGVATFFIASMKPKYYWTHDLMPRNNTGDTFKVIYENNKAQLKAKEAEPQGNEESIQLLRDYITKYEANVAALNGLDTKNYKAYYENSIKIEKINLDHGNRGITINFTQRHKDVCVNNIKIYQLLSAKNIDLIEEEISNQGLNSVRRLMNDKFAIMLMVFSIIIASPLFAGEVDNKTYKLLYTQGISKTKIFFGKFLSLVAVNLIVIITLLLAVFIYMSIKNGMGDLSYVLRSFEGYKLSVMSMGAYILNEIIIMFLIVLCISSFSCIVSVIVNNTGIALFINATIMIAMYFFTKAKYFLRLDAVNIFEYLDVNNVLYGIPFYMDIGYNLPQHVVMENAYVWFPIIAVIFIVVSLVIFRKKMVK
ncbi:ABC-type transport system involved in multi-copper enzyme maturation, permease component [Hathewaya proteolytica DSM 3090]|uniref:ABC-type transport system involved in multi-copper enzyme maturation, permease component n=1 Tax=Hathewaya proteolytica DSM 3090 TaxID=1121331 RepID=A0A1M6PHF6_9CLOT|nr:ABC transporter permease subunit [Hathewaya proteolytica]SHK07379.1 ABC-type transport system involved in multi-copper enzyme maturation, permease component [Hathewaya proteolytica DSM 3090]